MNYKYYKNKVLKILKDLKNRDFSAKDISPNFRGLPGFEESSLIKYTTKDFKQSSKTIKSIDSFRFRNDIDEELLYVNFNYSDEKTSKERIKSLYRDLKKLKRGRIQIFLDFLDSSMFGNILATLALIVSVLSILMTTGVFNKKDQMMKNTQIVEDFLKEK